MKDRFYLSCLRDNVGGNVAWHSCNGAGYVTDIAKAQVYSREEAQAAWNSLRSFDVPISAEHVERLLVAKVDCQHIPSTTELNPDIDTWVAYKRGSWSGNDVYWVTESGISVEFSNPKLFGFDQVKEFDGDDLIFIPFDVANKAKRSTFAYRHFKRRTMVQGAGIKQPEHVRRERRTRRTTGKVKMNCPDCGKINWQFNPHDFNGCSSDNCKSKQKDWELRYLE
jgi:hypothetical protein